MLFNWLRNRRRQRILAMPFPEAWERHLERNFGHFDHLIKDEKTTLRHVIKVLITEKRWEAAHGFSIDDTHKVTVAANAALLLLGMQHDYYSNVSSIILFPDAITGVPRHHQDGVVSEESALGLAYSDGPVILSWLDVIRGSINNRDGTNVVIHEFAHKLDMLDDIVDGTPALESREANEQWSKVMKEAFDMLRQQIERGESGVLDEYGATDEGEFFAVASECFFEQAVRLEKEHPEVYRLFKSFYGQDPAKWKERKH